MEFQIGHYKDNFLCDVMPMDACHILFGSPWKYDNKEIHNGKRHTYTFEKDGEKHVLCLLKNEKVEEEYQSKVMLLSGK